MNAWRQKLQALADTIDHAQQQRRRGVPFLSKPYAYCALEAAACLTCGLPAERIRVGSPEENPVGFDGFPIPVSFEPCGHRVSLTAEETDLVWSRLEQSTSEPCEPSNFVTAMPGETFQITQPPDTITINGADCQPLVTIHSDGQLDYGPGYTPDDAARAFWDALRHLAPARCPACGHIGLEGP